MAKQEITNYAKCAKCTHKGEPIYENVYLCRKGVNWLFGNFSIECKLFKVKDEHLKRLADQKKMRKQNFLNKKKKWKRIDLL